MTRALLLALLLAAPAGALTLHYEVRTPKPHLHLYEVSLEAGDLEGDHLDLAMPAWTPGYYKIQNHARNVREFAATDAKGGALPWKMTDKQTWRVETGGSRSVRASWRVYAHDWSATGSDLTDTHAYFHGSWLFMYVPGKIKTPVTLRLFPPDGWDIATGLERGNEKGTFTAPDYDVLIDCPVLMARFDRHTFRAGGVDHHVVIHGEPRLDRKAMVEDIRKIVEAQLAVFGGPPYREYTFLLHFPRWGAGGLEHLNSTSIVANGEQMGDRNQYLRFLFIVSHEFFHLWNVKRIRPEQLGPFDYSREVESKNLWVHEGFTTYYGWLLMQRAGVIDRKQYIEYVQEEIRNLQNREGRKITSPEMSSWHTWFDADDRDAVEVSYYTSGHLIGLLMDLEIRRRTSGAKSLDDVMRLAFEESREKGYPGDDFMRIVNAAAGSDFSEFFRRFVSGTEELPYGEILEAAGVAYEAKDEGKEIDPGFEVHGIGEDLCRVSRVREGTAADEAGIAAGDILVSTGDRRLRAGSFWHEVRSRKAGERMKFTAFRGERVMEFTVTLTEKAKIGHHARLVEKPTEEQKKLQDGWLK